MKQRRCQKRFRKRNNLRGVDCRFDDSLTGGKQTPVIDLAGIEPGKRRDASIFELLQSLSVRVGTGRTSGQVRGVKLSDDVGFFFFNVGNNLQILR